MANTKNPRPILAGMIVTPERAIAIKLALIKQYEDQYGVEVIGWKETVDGVTKKVYKKDLLAKNAPA